MFINGLGKVNFSETYVKAMKACQKYNKSLSQEITKALIVDMDKRHGIKED